MLRLAHKSKGKAQRAILRCATASLPILFLLLAISPANAQLNSNIAGVNLSATLATSLTVSASPGLVNFALVRSGTATGSSAITVNTSWVLNPGVARVRVYAYFTNAAAALTDGAGDNIPSSSVSGSANGGAFGTFTRPSPLSGATSVRISRTAITGLNLSGSKVDTLNLTISTTGLNLPAGTYTGVLNIQAQAL